MKIIIKVSILFFFFACNQSTKRNPVPEEVLPVADTLVQNESHTSPYLKNVKTTNGIFTLKDLTNKFCLVFGIGKNEPASTWENINLGDLKGYIINPSHEEFINLIELRAQSMYISPKKDSLPICKINNALIIPFTSNEDRTHLTQWKIISPDSILFDKLLHPILEKVYSNIVSIELLDLRGENYLSIYWEGGEGGENWDELTIVKLNSIDSSVDSFEIIEEAGVGYCHDCGNWAQIELKLNPDGLEIAEVRDSMKLVDNSWVSVWQKIKILKQIKI
jgi:hypothetical protein